MRQPLLPLAVLALLSIGCSHGVRVGTLTPSGLRYAAQAPAAARVAAGQPLALAVQDARQQPKGFSPGDDTIEVFLEGEHNGEIAYLARQLSTELSARGVPARPGTAGGRHIHLKVRTFQMRNRHLSSFGPHVSFTALSADASNGRQTVRVTAYVKRGKLPVWSYNELNQPCYVEPLQAAVRELASKLNRAFVGRSADDAMVDAIAAAVQSARGHDAVLAAYDLGATNNPRAIPALVALLSHKDELLRAAALSGLGTLGAVHELPRLQSIYRTGESTSDRYMALKAIGDLGTPEALRFLAEARAGADKKSREDIAELVGLYLDGRPPAAPVAPAPVAPAPVAPAPVAAPAAPAPVAAPAVAAPAPAPVQ